MTDQFRAMCAELAEELHEHTCLYEGHESELVARARALLAEPEAEGPRVGALVEWLQRRAAEVQAKNCTTIYSAYCLTRAADLLEQLSAPAAAPVPVGERLPGPEDCDAEDNCWQWVPDFNGHHPLGKWELQHRDWLSDPGGDATHWLPANALSTPEATNA